MRKLVTIIPLIIILTGCSTVRYVAVPSSSSDTVRIAAMRTDTLRIADSTVIDRRTDTVRVERWRTMERKVYRTDTLWRSRTDTVSVAVPTPEGTSAGRRIVDGLAGAACGAAAAVALTLIRRR